MESQESSMIPGKKTNATVRAIQHLSAAQLELFTLILRRKEILVMTGVATQHIASAIPASGVVQKTRHAPTANTVRSPTNLNGKLSAAKSGGRTSTQKT